MIRVTASAASGLLTRFLVAPLLGMTLTLPAFADYTQHPKVPELLQKLRSEYGFLEADLEAVVKALAQAEQVPKLIQAEQTAKEKTLTWDVYRKIHVRDENFRNGAKFLAEQRDWLARAEAQYGVPPAIVAAILGVETKYGAYSGPHRTLDALATQGFEHPTRSAFFFEELAAFFALCRENGFVATEVKGSYAGAIGNAQFMPSNYRRLALDFDGDGKKNLWSAPDAVGSIANYLVNYAPAKSWQRGLPIVVPAELDHAPAEGWPLNPRIQTHLLADYLRAGVRPRIELPPDTPVGLLELTLAGEPPPKEYWIGLPNFYAVMSYNPRVYYAMAVTQLAEELQRGQTPPNDAALR
jgi:membrane-bound lytic murein transglycosylase B